MLSLAPIRVYAQIADGEVWLQRHRGQPPVMACVLGFTATGLIPGISAAGATPADRQYTAIADAEFLHQGPHPHSQYPLPPLQVGVSPALITRTVVEAQAIPLYLFNAGLPQFPSVPVIDLGGSPARCLSSGQALSLTTAKTLLQQGLAWGARLAAQAAPGYLILGECVVGGTTTAQAVLMGLGINSGGRVNSSHPVCNHDQKRALVRTGLGQLERQLGRERVQFDPLLLVAGVGDPMQVAVAGMAIAASRTCGVLLAGGTQMLAVYALARAIAKTHALSWTPEQIVVGTTRWVAEDPTGDTVGLARLTGNVPLLATQLNFTASRYPQLRAYERGYVKEGVGAGGSAIAAHLYRNWSPEQLLGAIESLMAHHLQTAP